MSGIWDTLKSVGSAVGSAALGAGASAVSGALQFNQQKKLMKMQQDYENKTYYRNRRDNLTDYATQRKDYLSDLTNQYGRQVGSLENAGLNPALAYGNLNGAQPLGAEINQAQGGVMPSTSGAPSYDILGGMNTGLMFKAQLENLQADTNQKNTNSGVTQGRFDLDKEKWAKERDEIIPKTLSAMDADINLKVSQGLLNNETANKVKQEIANLGEQFKMLQIDSTMYQKFKDKEYEQLIETINKLKSETNLNGKTAALREVEKNWKKLGIGVGSNLFDSIYALLKGNKGEDVAKIIFDFVEQAIGQAATSLHDIVFGSDDGNKDGILTRIKNFFVGRSAEEGKDYKFEDGVVHLYSDKGAALLRKELGSSDFQKGVQGGTVIFDY
ncbi:Uncharacterised protein [Chlamydia trachomatis]|nr:Uncharacterised protein [Chlamydia trachomatis]